jgi:adenine-specific DNA-methyltransferase
LIKTIATQFDQSADAVIYTGDCRELVRRIPADSVRLVFTSPPYNIGKAYERKLSLPEYANAQSTVIRECYRSLVNGGSLCWQTGNYVANHSMVPLDILLWPSFCDELGMKLRNRIIWTVPHGLHCRKRFSGRYETVMWFTKGDDYYFDLDAVRTPQKWPTKKYYKGPKRGQISSDPRGKNPGDVWHISNVKFNHPEKTGHPCQFPEELVRRLVLGLTKPGDWILDPFLGSGTVAVVSLELGRRVIGADLVPSYTDIAIERIVARIGEDRVRLLPATGGTNLV